MKSDEKKEGKKREMTPDERAALETMRLEDARGGTQSGGGQNLTEQEMSDMGGG